MPCRMISDFGGFQLTAARRRLPQFFFPSKIKNAFQLTAARRRLLGLHRKGYAFPLFQLTAARRRLQAFSSGFGSEQRVSTHSRPKAAAKLQFGNWVKALFQLTAARRRLPPNTSSTIRTPKFQLTAARRRLLLRRDGGGGAHYVSTHSRPKAAAFVKRLERMGLIRFNSQPPEGGCRLRIWIFL